MQDDLSAGVGLGKMPELSKEEKKKFTQQWTKELASDLERDSPWYYNLQHPQQLQRLLRDAKRGVVAGIAWAENGRSIAAGEAVVKCGGQPGTVIDDRGRDLFEIAVAEVGDDEEFDALLDQISTPMNGAGGRASAQCSTSGWRNEARRAAALTLANRISAAASRMTGTPILKFAIYLFERRI